MMLQKQELVERLAKKGYTKKDSKTILDDVFNVVMEGLVEAIRCRYMASAPLRCASTTPRRSPQCARGETITVPAYKAPRFIPGKCSSARSRKATYASR